jgi:hypothetical protein
MSSATSIVVAAHNLAAVINPIGCSVRGARDIDRGEAPPIPQKAMPPTAITIAAHDLAAPIDSFSYGNCSIWDSEPSMRKRHCSRVLANHTAEE